ncbi:MAG: hypothetical protein KAH01_07645 [Caldisericia bacterium]|nr:hypothetical protein [Caldisericia bacterium]
MKSVTGAVATVFDPIQFHHVLGRDSGKVVTETNLLKDDRFIVPLLYSEHVKHTSPKIRKKIIKHIYFTHGVQAIEALIKYGKQLGTYPNIVIEAIDLLEGIK